METRGRGRRRARAEEADSARNLLPRLAAMQLRDFNVHHGIPRASFQLGISWFDGDIGEGVVHEGREGGSMS